MYSGGTIAAARDALHAYHGRPTHVHRVPRRTAQQRIAKATGTGILPPMGGGGRKRHMGPAKTTKHKHQSRQLRHVRSTGSLPPSRGMLRPRHDQRQLRSGSMPRAASVATLRKRKPLAGRKLLSPTFNQEIEDLDAQIAEMQAESFRERALSAHPSSVHPSNLQYHFKGNSYGADQSDDSDYELEADSAYMRAAIRGKKATRQIQKESAKIQRRIKQKVETSPTGGVGTHSTAHKEWLRQEQAGKEAKAAKLLEIEAEKAARLQSKRDWWYGRTANWQKQNMDKKPKKQKRKKNSIAATGMKRDPGQLVDVLFSFGDNGEVKLNFEGNRTLESASANSPSKKKEKVKDPSPTAEPKQPDAPESKPPTPPPPPPPLPQVPPPPCTAKTPTSNPKTNASSPSPSPAVFVTEDDGFRSMSDEDENEESNNFERECLAGETLIVREMPGEAGISMCFAIHGQEGDIDIALTYG